MASSFTNPQPLMDTSRRFVRVRNERANGFIEFEFAIGEPEVFVELILGQVAFAEFCVTNKVEMLPPLVPRSAEDGERSDWDWRMSDATNIRFR